VAWGGIDVAPMDRKPGDLQQSLVTEGGAFTGKGHSSQVWAVRGPATVLLGQPGSPTVIGTVGSPGPVETLSGWYRVEDDGLVVEVTRETDPATIADLDSTWIQLIDANIAGAADETGSRRGSDATSVGYFDEHQAYSAEGTSSVVSNGRLPDSKWIGWQRDPSQGYVARLAKSAPKAAETVDEDI